MDEAGEACDRIIRETKRLREKIDSEREEVPPGSALAAINMAADKLEELAARARATADAANDTFDGNEVNRYSKRQTMDLELPTHLRIQDLADDGYVELTAHTKDVKISVTVAESEIKQLPDQL